jgi:hypothetical protein
MNEWQTKMLANDDDFISFSLSRIASFQLCLSLFTYRNVYNMKFDTYALLFIKHKSGFKSWLNLSLERESYIGMDEMKGVDEWNEMIS